MLPKFGCALFESTAHELYIIPLNCLNYHQKIVCNSRIFSEHVILSQEPLFSALQYAHANLIIL